MIARLICRIFGHETFTSFSFCTGAYSVDCLRCHKCLERHGRTDGR
jgi:hypothetical protein